MKSAVTKGAYNVELVESATPAPGKGQVLVKMLAAGICASDMQIYHGKHKYVKFPIVQGHEGVGVVAATGEGVSQVKAGDMVCIQQQIACGECYACRKGRHNVCLQLKAIGIHLEGLFADYFLSPVWNLIKVPDGFSVDKGMLAEPASVGVNSARVGKVVPGERAVVIGAGIIGNFTAQACMALGAADVLVSDISPAKLEVAKANGIRHVVDAKADLGEAIRQAFGDNPPDVVFDCAGVEASIRQALAVAANASRVVIVANFKAPVTFEIPSFQRREITIHSVMGTVKESTIEAIDLLHKDKMTINQLITKRFPLANMTEAYKFVDDNPLSVMKIAIDISK